MKIDISGDKRLRRKLRSLAGKPIQKASKIALRAGAVIVRREAKARAPLGPTGNLRRSVKYRTLRKRTGEAAAYVVKATAPHSHLVQLGTSRGARPNPFVERAYQATKSQVAMTVEQVLFEEIETEFNK